MTDLETPACVMTRSHNISVTISICGDVTHLAVSGRLIHGAESEGLAVEAFARCFRWETRLIVIDLGGIQKIDAAGLGFLAFAYSEAQHSGAHLVVENAPRFIRRLFRITGLDKFFNPNATDRERF